MELRRLRYFVALAEELHFGRAAKRLGICQPPLTRQIRELETELGTLLFHRARGRGRIHLTEVGRMLLGDARRALWQVEQTVRSAQQMGRGEMGTLRVGFIGSASCNVLPEVLRTFRERYRGVTLRFHEQTTDQQTQALRAGQIDVGFVRPPLADEVLATELVLREPLVLALPASHPLARRARVSLQQVAEESFVLFPRHLGPSFYDQVVTTCRRAGFSPRLGQEAVELHTIVSLVAAGMGAALVPASFRNLRRTGVAYPPLAEPTEQVEMALAWRRDDASPLRERFIAVVREITGRRGATVHANGSPRGPRRGAVAEG